MYSMSQVANRYHSITCCILHVFAQTELQLGGYIRTCINSFTCVILTFMGALGIPVKVNKYVANVHIYHIARNFEGKIF